MKKTVWFLVAAFLLVAVVSFNNVQEADAFPGMGADCWRSGCHDGVARPVIKGFEPPKPAPAPAPAPKPAPAPVPAPKPAPTPAPVATAPKVVENKVYVVDYKALGKAGKVDIIVHKGDVYVGIRSAATQFAATPSWEAEVKRATLSGSFNDFRYELKMRQGHKGITINGKLFMLTKPVINVDGRLYVQAHSLAKVTGDVMKAPQTATLVRNVLEIK